MTEIISKFDYKFFSSEHITNEEFAKIKALLEKL